MPEDPLDLIFGRRSIRLFTGAPVSEAHVQRILEAAMAAPSAVAKDPWRFIVVREPATLENLGRELSNGAMLPQAGLGVVICGDLAAAHDRQLSYLLQDCSAAIQNLLLAAHGLGLGACWLGVHPRENRQQHLRTVLGIPELILPVACIAVGHPAERKAPRTRYRADFGTHRALVARARGRHVVLLPFGVQSPESGFGFGVRRSMFGPPSVESVPSVVRALVEPCALHSSRCVEKELPPRIARMTRILIRLRLRLPPR